MPASPVAPGDRLLVVSSPASTEANQLIYEALEGRGWEVHLVIPRTWRDDFDGQPYATRIIPSLGERGRRLPIVLPGRPQRHFYLGALAAMVRAIAPRAAFVESETYSASAYQWSRALGSNGIPFGTQSDENLGRRLPLPARMFEREVLKRAQFVAARSPRAMALVGSEMRAELVPHPVIEWAVGPASPTERPFTIGFAGRLTEAKGVRDLLAAVETIDDASLLVVGDGELRGEVEAAARRTGRIELLTGVRHADMPEMYRRMDVLVLPSRTTPTWAEQFGRVLVEAMWSGVPAVGSSSGEIPWVIETTGGGVVFPEGDVAALTRVLEELRGDPERRRQLADAGRRAVGRRFTVSAVAAVMDRILRSL